MPVQVVARVPVLVQVLERGGIVRRAPRPIMGRLIPVRLPGDGAGRGMGARQARRGRQVSAECGPEVSAR